MTIAAGFRVEDGILLCADTLYTGAMKIHQHKIFPVSFGDTKDPEHFVFALAGNEAYGKTAIDKCTEALTDLGPKNRELRKVKAALRSALKDVYETYVYSRPESERQFLEFSFMIGAWLPRGGGAQLFSTEGPAVNLQHDYDCIGTGSYLGHYLIRPVFNPMMKLPAIVVLATQMLSAAKAYDTNCGGSSTFMIIKNGGLNPLFSFSFQHVEAITGHLELLAHQLLSYVTNSALDETTFQHTLDMFIDSIKRMRTTWMKDADEFEKLVYPSSATSSSTDQT